MYLGTHNSYHAAAARTQRRRCAREWKDRDCALLHVGRGGSIVRAKEVPARGARNGAERQPRVHVRESAVLATLSLISLCAGVRNQLFVVRCGVPHQFSQEEGFQLCEVGACTGAFDRERERRGTMQTARPSGQRAQLHMGKWTATSFA